MNSTGYGQTSKPHGRYESLCFDGDETKYEHWEIKFLAYMKLRKLKKIIIADEEEEIDEDSNEEAFAELIQFLDQTSLGLVIREARDDGRKALKILCEHYAGNGKPRIISLYTKLTSLQKDNLETVTEYVIRAETTATALKSVGEIISDGLLIAMIMKGLPAEYKPFIVVNTQSEKILTFQKFKVALRNYEENESSSNTDLNTAVMKLKVRDERSANIKCYTCGMMGHKSFECKERKWCGVCKSSSHSEESCRRKQKYNRNDTAVKCVQNKYTGENEIHDEEVSFIFMTSEENNDSKNDSLLVDCGATAHIINEERYFISFDESYQPENHFIELADGSRSNNVAKKRGTAVVSIQDENGTARTAELKNALYIPSYPQKIFSVQSATENGAEIHFTSKNAELMKNGVRFPIKKEGKLYFLYKCNAGVKKSDEGNVSSRSYDLDTWHRILGHCNKFDIISSEKVVNGMKIKDKNYLNCISCILGKQKRFMNGLPDKRAENKMELIHIDLSGKIEPISREGFQYAMIFVDDFSSVIFVYFLKNKSNAVDALKRFLADTSIYGSTRRIRTDNGGEFVSDEFQKVLIENKIKVEYTCPYSPHQNGTAERNWQSLFNMVRTLLIDSKLPKEFWVYAVSSAAYIRNRCFNQRIKNTPQFLLTNVKPNYNNLHIFGSLCYPYIETYKKKLENRSYEGIFLGYDKYSPSYFVFDRETNKIKKHRVVEFTEKYPQNETNQTQKYRVDDTHFDLDLTCEQNEITNNNEDQINRRENMYQETNDRVNEDNADKRNELETENEITQKRIRTKPQYLNDYVCHVDYL